ncbi:MAG: hypothetical protein EOP23_17475 [Hyphomicrobiales bacterium]|nr:MAG: hypothetical protein EOP23_17475 [Hyphomicrobiales bacterium]
MTTTLKLPLKGTKRSRMAPGTQLLPDGSGGVVSHWWEVQWPRIGGQELLPLDDHAFTTPAFLQGYEAGRLVFIYACGCGQDHRNPSVANGLLGVAKRLYACLHKVSVTGQAHIRSRLRELNHHRYGCQTGSENGFPCSDRGFDNWIAQLILPLGTPLKASPVRVGGSCLEVRLPIDLSTEEFEERLHKHMRNAALNEWLDTEEGQAHCRQIGRNPDEFRRLTGYGFATETRISKAKEFYFFRPKSRDADRLVRIAEVIIHDWVTNPVARQLVSFKCKGQGFYGPDSAAVGSRIA